MNEDLKPLYDVASCWTLITSDRSHALYQHTEKSSLFRYIDFENQRIIFNDVDRIIPQSIIDINKDIGIGRKEQLVRLVTYVMTMVKPIEMPYIPERLKVYVEDFGNVTAILYYMNSDKDKTIVPIKRFFRETRDPVASYEELSQSEYYKIRSIYNVDTNTE